MRKHELTTCFISCKTALHTVLTALSPALLIFLCWANCTMREDQVGSGWKCDIKVSPSAEWSESDHYTSLVQDLHHQNYLIHCFPRFQEYMGQQYSSLFWTDRWFLFLVYQQTDGVYIPDDVAYSKVKVSLWQKKYAGEIQQTAL